jgi:hypothetical protein
VIPVHHDSSFFEATHAERETMLALLDRAERKTGCLLCVED